MSGTHSRGELVSCYLLQSLDLPCCQPSTRAARTVSNPAATLRLAQGPRGRREVAAGEYPSLSPSGKQSNRRTCCTAVLLPKQPAVGRAGTVAVLYKRMEEPRGCSILRCCHSPCSSWTVCSQRKALGNVLLRYIPFPILAR